MIRRADSGAGEVPNEWEGALDASERLTFRQVLIFERAGWPRGTALLRHAFWQREDVPAELRGRHAPGRPDPRTILTNRSRGAMEEYLAAVSAWRETEAEFQAARLAWLEERAAAA